MCVTFHLHLSQTLSFSRRGSFSNVMLCRWMNGSWHSKGNDILPNNRTSHPNFDSIHPTVLWVLDWILCNTYVCLRWLGNQHWRCWKNLGNTQRQARELILGPCRGTKIRLLSFNRIQSRVATGLLTRHNTLQRHLHVMRLTDSPLCRKCGVDDRTFSHILCQCEALASLRHAHLGSFFLEPENIKNISLGAIWTFSKVAGLPWETTGAQRAHYLTL
jgi:hypothetical protein